MTKAEVDKHLPLILECLLDSGQTNKSVAEDVGCTAMQIKRALYNWRLTGDREKVTEWDEKRKKVIKQTRRGGMAKAHTAMRKKWAEASGTTDKTPLELIEGAPITPEEAERLKVYWRPTGTAANYNLSGARTMLRENSKLTICGVARVMEYDPKALENALNRSNQKRVEAGLSEEEWHELEVLWWEKMTWLKERNMANDQTQTPALAPAPAIEQETRVARARREKEEADAKARAAQDNLAKVLQEEKDKKAKQAFAHDDERRREKTRTECIYAVIGYMEKVPLDRPSVRYVGYALDSIKAADMKAAGDVVVEQAPAPAASPALEPVIRAELPAVYRNIYHTGYKEGFDAGVSQFAKTVELDRETQHPYVFWICYNRILALQEKEVKLVKGIRGNLIRFIYMAMTDNKTCNGLQLVNAFSAKDNPWKLSREKVVKSVRELHGSLFSPSNASKAVAEIDDAHVDIRNVDITMWLKREKDLDINIKLTPEGLKQAKRLIGDATLTCAAKTESYKKGKGKEEFNG